MPNWKKVIVSGSSAALTSVTATAGFTGSLSGSATSATSASYALTASYASTAQTLLGSVTSASYALTASYVNPLIQTVTITGSLITSGSDGKGINTSTTELNAGSGTGITINWGSGQLFDNNSINTVDWLNAYTLTSPSFGGVTTVQWNSGLLNSLNTSMSIDWDTRVAYDSAGTGSIEWGGHRLNDSLNLRSIHWGDRYLYDTSEIVSSDWNNRTLYDHSSGTSVEWDNRALYDSTGAGSIDWESRNLYDSTGASSVNWEDRFLISATSAIKTFDWSSDYWLFSPSYQKDVKSIDLQDTVSGLGASDDTYLGDIIDGRITSTGPGYPSNGQLVYLYSDGFWYPYDQTDTAVYGKMVGLVFKVDTGGETCKVLLEGHVVIDNIIGPVVQGVDHGLPVYIKYLTTTGEMDTGSPSDGIIQVLGHCYYKNSTTSDYWMMKFKPSNDWYEAT